MYELATNLEDGIDGVAVLPVAGCHVQVPCHGHGLHRSTAAAGSDHGDRSGRRGASGQGRRGEATLQALSAESRWEWWGVAGSIIVSLWLTLPLPVLKRKKFEPAPRAPGFLLVCSFSLLGSAHCQLESFYRAPMTTTAAPPSRRIKHNSRTEPTKRQPPLHAMAAELLRNFRWNTYPSVL